MHPSNVAITGWFRELLPQMPVKILWSDDSHDHCLFFMHVHTSIRACILTEQHPDRQIDLMRADKKRSNICAEHREM
jgi:hypothetical protein